MEKFEKISSFIRSTFKKPEGFISLHEPVFSGNEKQYILEAIDSTFVSSVGKFVDEFEYQIEKFTGAKKAVACVNGTSALHLALIVEGVKPGDEVITQNLTFIATVNAIINAGAVPVFIDVDLQGLGLSPEALEIWLVENTVYEGGYSINKKTGRRVAACVPMHTFGHPCNMDEILSVCKKYKLIVVEDAAESLGSYYKGKHTGTLGDAGILSFNGNKIITTGGGGMLLYNDFEKAALAKHLSTQAKIPHRWEFNHDYSGFNFRMPNLNAALGLAQLEKIEDYLLKKRKLADSYKNFFESLEIAFVSEPDHAKSNYWLNAVLLNNRAERDKLLTITNDSGIMTRPAWELMHNLSMFTNYQTGNLNNSIWIADRLVNLPSSVIQL